MSTKLPLPKRGEIWLANFDPTVGAEIKKIRPAIVINSDIEGRNIQQSTSLKNLPVAYSLFPIPSPAES